MENVEIVQSPNAALAELTAKLEDLKQRAELTVVDTDTCAKAKTVELDVKAYIKAVELSDYARDVADKKIEYERAANTLKELIRPGEELEDKLKKNRKTWEMEERRRAQVEQDRINAENKRLHDEQVERERLEAERIAKNTREIRVSEIRGQLKRGEIGKRQAEKLLREAGAEEEAAKAGAAAAEDEAKAKGPAKVTVAPAIPTMRGTVSRVNWKFEVTDETKVSRVWCDPSDGKGKNRIGEYVRQSKSQADGDAAAKLIGGIRVWPE